METMRPDYRTFYRDHMLTCRPFATEDGRFQARVVISALGGLKTQAQRFLDLDTFDSHDEAVAAARYAGIQWVDKDVPVEVARKLWNLQEIAGAAASARLPVVKARSSLDDRLNRRRDASDPPTRNPQESLHGMMGSADKQGAATSGDFIIRSKRP
jgi:hypothetical protein